MVQTQLKYNIRSSQKCPQSFTGKERDSETGFSYFGARYYDSDLMTGWLSVDPMADKYPNLSPYAYCAWNPVKLVDPDGEEIMMNDDWWKNRNKNPNGTYSIFYKSTKGQPGETIERDGETYDWVGGDNFAPVDEYGIPYEKEDGSYYSSAPWIGYANKELMDEENNKENPQDSNKGGHIDLYMKSCGLSEGLPWCAGFVNWCLNESGYEGAGASGKNYKKWSGGINLGKNPEYGSIAVFKTGHVGFVIGISGNGTIEVIHGNWSNGIQRSNYIKFSEIDSFVRPINKP